MVPPCSDRISRVPPYSRTARNPYPYGAFTLFGATFQNASGSFRTATGLVRVRSPLLTESRLMSFPPVTEMFQFTGFASHGYVFTARYRRSGGSPHVQTGFHVSRPTRGPPTDLPVRGYHPLRPAFPDGSGFRSEATGLVRVRSSLLTESRLMSFPPATEIFQFAGFASLAYGFSQK